MKITFTPMNPPAPVRPADMPDGVAYECRYPDGQVQLRINSDGGVWCIDENEKPNYWLDPIYAYKTTVVLKRRDGQPLPSVPDLAPLPLDQLEPFPAWYPDRDGSYWARVGQGCIVFNPLTGASHNFKDADNAFNKSGKVEVHPTPHIMEVQP